MFADTAGTGHDKVAAGCTDFHAASCSARPAVSLSLVYRLFQEDQRTSMSIESTAPEAAKSEPPLMTTIEEYFPFGKAFDAGRKF